MKTLGKSAIGVVARLMLMVTVPFFPHLALSAENEPCGYFSPDPNDRSGPPIHFFADLSDEPQRAPTDSPGIGRADFVLERDTLRLSWTITYKDLTSLPIGLHMHGPVPAEGDAPPIFDLAEVPFSSPVQGKKELTLGELAYLVQNLIFVNLHTEKYPAGELRGPVRKIAPVCSDN